MANAINWFEIPASNLDRAVKFYAKVFDTELPISDVMDAKLAFFTVERGEVGGCIAYGERYKPSDTGTLVYLNGGDDLSTPLARVQDAGGKVEMPKTKISDEVGFMAIIRDTEGNRVAFHSMA